MTLPVQNASPDSAIQTRTSEQQQFLCDVLQGLSETPRRLPSKYFYDERGSQLFDQICKLDEYYLTGTETAIMKANATEMARVIGRRCIIVEYGSGSSVKTRILLEHLDVAAYVPVDISADHLEQTAAGLRADYAEIGIEPLCADFTQELQLPPLQVDGRRIVYFPGLTLGNFPPAEASELLRKMAHVAGPHGGLLIGIDLKKDRRTLHNAYNDASGITAQFNENVLVRINEELGGDFNLDLFEHRAIYNESGGRIEMHLVSLASQTVTVDGQSFAFLPGESICTEFSHKYDLPQFSDMASATGWAVEKVWSDPKRLFAVVFATCEQSDT